MCCGAPLSTLPARTLPHVQQTRPNVVVPPCTYSHRTRTAHTLPKCLLCCLLLGPTTQHRDPRLPAVGRPRRALWRMHASCIIFPRGTLANDATRTPSLHTALCGLGCLELLHHSPLISTCTAPSFVSASPPPTITVPLGMKQDFHSFRVGAYCSSEEPLVFSFIFSYLKKGHSAQSRSSSRSCTVDYGGADLPLCCLGTGRIAPAPISARQT